MNEIDSRQFASRDQTVIPSIADLADFRANAEAIDELVTTTTYKFVVAWGKWLGFTPTTVQKHVMLAEAENAPEDAIQKIDGVWLRLDDICNETNRERVHSIATDARPNHCI